MKIVGYLEGTDGVFLTRLAAKGVDTLPLGNGADNHGKYVGFVDHSDSISLVIGYLHKVLPLSRHSATRLELLQACQINRIPVLLIVPSELHADVKKLDIMRDLPENVQLVDPAEVMARAGKVLGF